MGKTMARPREQGTHALGEHKSSHSCHQTSQSPAGIPGGKIRLAKHILFLLLEVPSAVEMNWPSVPLPATFWQAVKLVFICCHFPSVLTKVRENCLVFP